MVMLMTSSAPENGAQCVTVAEALRLLQLRDKQWFELRQGHTATVAHKPLFDLWLEGDAR